MQQYPKTDLTFLNQRALKQHLRGNSAQEIQQFVEDFHDLGCGHLDRVFSLNDKYRIIRSIYCKYRDNQGWLTKKQVLFVKRLIEELK